MENKQEKLDLLLSLYTKKDLAKKESDKAEKEYKELQTMLISELDDSFEYSGYKFTKTGRDSYSLKDGVDKESIIKNYPQAIKLDCNELYKVADKPEEILVNNRSEWFLVKKNKEEKKVQEF